MKERASPKLLSTLLPYSGRGSCPQPCAGRPVPDRADEMGVGEDHPGQEAMSCKPATPQNLLVLHGSWGI